VRPALLLQQSSEAFPQTDESCSSKSGQSATISSRILGSIRPDADADADPDPDPDFDPDFDLARTR
jgi:hypothetical protein